MPELFSGIAENAGNDLPHNPLTYISQLLLSGIIGFVIAFHVCWFDSIRKKSRRMNIAKAQVLICITGTMMVIVIGESVARAFGVVGLGSFIRFRTTVEDPLDGAVLLVLLAIGMSVGVGAYSSAAFFGAFFYIIIWILSNINVPERIKGKKNKTKLPKEGKNKPKKDSATEKGDEKQRAGDTKKESEEEYD